MARKDQNTEAQVEGVEEGVEGGTNETNEAAAENTQDSRLIMIQDPATNEQIARKDWIRKVYQEEGGEYYGDRGKIAKKLTQLQGKKVPYQIVFAATKDLKHIRKPEAESTEGAETETQEAEG